MRKMDFDAIAASVPLDKTAGSVVARSGAHYDPVLKEVPHMLHWQSPPALKPTPRDAPKLEGVRFGRFLVLGMWAGAPTSGKQGKWVARCSCGDYEARTSRAIRNPLNTDDCCRNCRHVKHIKRRYDQLGAKPLADFIGKKA